MTPRSIDPLLTARLIETQIIEDLSTKGWSVSDAFVSVADVGLLAAEANRMFSGGDFHAAGAGTYSSDQVNAAVRGDDILWLDPDRGGVAQRAYAITMEALRMALNKNLFLGLLDLDVHFAIFEPGAFYQTHQDRPRTAAHRTVSCILYLNEAWSTADGGQLRLYLEDRDCEPWVDIEPTGGRLVCFLSERFFHEVLPAERRRVGLSGWFGRRH